MRGTALCLCIENAAIKKECVNSRQETLSDPGPLSPFICPLLFGSCQWYHEAWGNRRRHLSKTFHFGCRVLTERCETTRQKSTSFLFCDLDIVRFLVITRKRNASDTSPFPSSTSNSLLHILPFFFSSFLCPFFLWGNIKWVSRLKGPESLTQKALKILIWLSLFC